MLSPVTLGWKSDWSVMIVISEVTVPGGRGEVMRNGGLEVVSRTRYINFSRFVNSWCWLQFASIYLERNNSSTAPPPIKCLKGKPRLQHEAIKTTMS